MALRVKPNCSLPIGAFVVLASAVPLAAARNGVAIADLRGVAGQPFTISRVFAEGEIHGFAKPRIDGGFPAVWQCDVMTRWTDGSVQHALVSFVADKAQKNLNVDFAEDAHACSVGDRKSCDAAGLTQEQMLAFGAPKGWGAAMETVVAGRKHVILARDMLAAGAWRYWLRGPAVTQAIVEDRSPKLAYDWGYKDRRILVMTKAIEKSATAADVVDAAELAAMPMPQKVRIDGEEAMVCAVRDNRLNFGSSTCPNADGRGLNGTTATPHLFGAVAQILAIGNPGGWRERVLGYTWPFNNTATKASTPGPEFLAHLARPAKVQVGAELLQVCKVNFQADGSVEFGPDAQHCQDKKGRGLDGTIAAAHIDRSPVSSPDWPSEWVEAPNTGYKSLHPIFVLTFYRNWPGVKVEYIVENNWATKLQDQFYNVTLKSGREDEQNRFQVALNHRAMTRWRQTFWDGIPAPTVNIDYNLAYLTQSHALPNYDLTKHVSKVAIADEIARFEASDKGEINGHCQWLQAMPTAGGRPDIGLFARWYVRYLYTFDPRMFTVMMGNGAVSGYIPIHLRESAPERHGFGGPVSLDGRPGLVSRAFDLSESRDLIVPVGMTLALPRTGTARRADGWNVDQAHQPSLAYIPYLITGDWYFLEELYFWGTYNLAYGTPGACEWCRHDDWGFITESAAETRGLGWALRNLAHAAWFAPDGSAEKAYFVEKLNDNFAVREGIAGLKDGAFYDPKLGSKWSWGRTVVGGGKTDPLHLGRRDLGSESDPKVAGGCYADAPWMENYRLIAMGHIAELGFAGLEPLRRWFAVNLLHQIADPGYAPKGLIAAYWIPTRGISEPCSASPPLENWAELARHIPGSEQAAAEKRWAAGTSDAEHGYPTIAFAAASFLPGIKDGTLSGEEAWSWMKAHLAQQDALNDNPKWALVPREQK